MLVQTIQISFSSYAADTIRIHTGETGREILFVPDMEISGNYSADFIVIKPDDTFTIAAATITDGKINVEIPEQAGAVAGAGHYILKIYDSGEVCIYSASGGFMVDDHLLTDGIIESVAEVYGYQFPQDFAIINDDETSESNTWSSSKIAEEIAAASPDLIDDNEVLYDKTWSSEKISYELGNVQPFHVYTSTEQPVGRWIDGKILYEKTFTVTSPAAISVGTCNAYKVAELTGVDVAMFKSGVFIDATGHRNYGLSYDRYYSGTDKMITEVYVDTPTNTMYVYATCPRTSGFTVSELTVTVQYTKSTI